jgi:hypothetical protein
VKILTPHGLPDAAPNADTRRIGEFAGLSPWHAPCSSSIHHLFRKESTVDASLLTGVFQTVLAITVTLLGVFLVGAVTVLVHDSKHHHAGH